MLRWRLAASVGRCRRRAEKHGEAEITRGNGESVGGCGHCADMGRTDAAAYGEGIRAKAVALAARCRAARFRASDRAYGTDTLPGEWKADGEPRKIGCGPLPSRK